MFSMTTDIGLPDINTPTSFSVLNTVDESFILNSYEYLIFFFTFCSPNKTMEFFCLTVSPGFIVPIDILSLFKSTFLSIGDFDPDGYCIIRSESIKSVLLLFVISTIKSTTSPLFIDTGPVTFTSIFSVEIMFTPREIFT